MKHRSRRKEREREKEKKGIIDSGPVKGRRDEGGAGTREHWAAFRMGAFYTALADTLPHMKALGTGMKCLLARKTKTRFAKHEKMTRHVS